MITFDKLKIAEHHGPLIVGAPEVPIRRAKYWDVWGEGEVVGQQGGRNIFVSVLIHGGYTLKQFIKQIESLEGKLGVNGTLEETGDLVRTYKRCTLDTFEPMPLAGQEEPGPLPDCGVLTYTNSNGQQVLDNGYFAGYQLRFRQLLVS